MSLLIAIVVVILLPLVIIWWIDVTVEDEFYANFKTEPDVAAVKPGDEEVVTSRLVMD